MYKRQTGGIQGIAQDAQKQPMPKVQVQVRDDDGDLAAIGFTNAQGAFSFTGLPPGIYTVEILNAAGQIAGTASVSVTVGAVATVSVSAAAAGALAAGAGGGLGLLGLGALGTIAVVGGAVALSTAAIVATRGDASPSR